LRRREWWGECWLKQRVFLDKIGSVARERVGRREMRKMIPKKRRRQVNRIRIVLHCLLHLALDDMPVQQRGRWKAFGYGKRVVVEIGDS
jgi:hypothetical protein